MATYQLSFVPGRRAGKENAVLNGYRFILDRKRDEKLYMRCALHSEGCKARITVIYSFGTPVTQLLNAGPSSSELLRIPLP